MTGTEGKAAKAAVDEATRIVADANDEAAIKAIDALSTYYLTILDNSLKLQATLIETTKSMLDSSLAQQGAVRKLAESTIESNRTTRTAWVQATEANLRGYREAFKPGAFQTSFDPKAMQELFNPKAMQELFNPKAFQEFWNPKALQEYWASFMKQPAAPAR